MFPWNMLPFNKDTKNLMNQMKPEEIEKYVQEMMAKMMPQNMQGIMNPLSMNSASPLAQNPSGSQPSPLDSAVFETHNYVYVRLPIKKEEWLKEIKIYHTSNQMIIENIPDKNDKHTITLPAIVKKKGATAQHKDGMLEIKVPKSIDMQFSEIDITELP